MSNLSDYTSFDFPSSSGQTFAVSQFIDGLYSFTDGYSHLTGTTNVTFTGMSSGYNRTIINSTTHTLTILPGSIAVAAATCALLSYNGSVWSQLVAFSGTESGPGNVAGGDLSGTYPNPTVKSLTGNAGTINIASSGNIFTWNTATTAPGIAQTIATAASTPQNIMLAPQAPNASSTGPTAGTPGSFVVSLSAPVSSGVEPAFMINRSGVTIAQLSANSISPTAATLWLSLNGATPDGTNYALSASAGSIIINAISVSGQVIISADSQTLAAFTPTASALYLSGLTVVKPSIGWHVAVVAPQLIHNPQTTDSAAATLSIIAQSAYSSAVTNINGANIHIQGGAAKTNGSTGLRGGVKLQLGADTTENMITCVEPAVGSRVSTLNTLTSSITTTNVPNGDGLTFVGAAQTNPTLPPVGGFLLWSDHTSGDGYFCNPGGAPNLLGVPSYPLLNPTIDGYSQFSPTPAQITAQGINGAQIITQMWGIRTTNASPTALVGSFPVDGYSGGQPWGVIEIDVIHMMSATTGSPLAGAKFKSSMSWTVSSGGTITSMGAMSQPVAIGTNGGAVPSGWSSTIQLSGNQIQIIATGDGSLTVDHSALVQIYYSY